MPVLGGGRWEFAVFPEWIEKLHALLSDLRPNWIFAPFVNDPHPDHRACSDLLRAVLQRGFPGQEDLTIFSYEVSSFLPANVYFRIDRLIRRKEQWLLSYQNGLKSVDYVDFCLWRHAYASRIYTNQPGYIECFLVLRPEEYLSAEAFAESSILILIEELCESLSLSVRFPNFLRRLS